MMRNIELVKSWNDIGAMEHDDNLIPIIYYQNWTDEQQLIYAQRYIIDDKLTDRNVNRFSHFVNIKANNEYFIELLESIIDDGYEYINILLSNMMNEYVYRCRANYKSDNTNKYYYDWLNNTSLILKNKYPVLSEWIESKRNELKTGEPNDNITQKDNKQYCETIISKEDIENKLIKNYEFWKESKSNHKHDNAYKNIFDGISISDFLNMVEKSAFSTINKRGISQRIKYNVVVLSRIKGIEWGKKAAAKLNTTYAECQKMTAFEEYEEIKNMYL